jgi:hypothetical protein
MTATATKATSQPNAWPRVFRTLVGLATAASSGVEVAPTSCSPTGASPHTRRRSRVAEMRRAYPLDGKEPRRRRLMHRIWPPITQQDPRLLVVAPDSHISPSIKRDISRCNAMPNAPLVAGVRTLHKTCRKRGK